MKSNSSLDLLTCVHFDIVGSCQLRCVGCPNSTIRKNVTRIDPQLFGRCISNIDVRRVNTFRFFNYGEPLLHTELRSMFDTSESARAFEVDHAELSTNAQFVRWDQLEYVISRRVLHRLVVSCDGDGTPASYERMRPPVCPRRRRGQPTRPSPALSTSPRTNFAPVDTRPLPQSLA